MSEDEADHALGPRQKIRPERDAYVAGRDFYQYLDLSSEDTALRALSAGKGASRLTAVAEADKTLERAGRLLIGVSASEAAPALKVLLERDGDLVVALFASISEAKAEDLVTEMGPAGAGLGTLLEAAEAITQCESTVHKALGDRTGWFTRASSPRGTQGFLQMYANGAIHWTPRYGAYATIGATAQYHQDAGGIEGRLGFPVAAATQAQHPGTGTECSWQLFEGPQDYSLEVCAYLGVQCGGTVISSQQHGTYATWGGIGELSALGWRDRTWMGLPVDDAVPAGPSGRINEAGTSGWCQRFESGTVYDSDKTGAIRVPRLWADYLKSRGDVAGSTGFPVSPVLAAEKSPYDTTGHFQRFEGARDYPADVVDRRSDRERPGGAAIYHSPQHGVYTVSQGNGLLYERLNGTAGWLGFPTSDETDTSGPAGSAGRTIQRFEGGAIYYSPRFDSVPVKRAVLDYLLAERSSPEDWLGFPTGEAEPLASGKGEYIQFFEYGVVTFRENLIKAWLDCDRDSNRLPSVREDGRAAAEHEIAQLKTNAALGADDGQKPIASQHETVEDWWSE